MFRKKSLLAACALLAASAWGADPLSYPKPRCADRFDFEKRINLAAWPRSSTKDITQTAGRTGKAMRICPGKNRVSAYGTMPLNIPGPGTISISFDYKIEDPAAVRLEVAVNCNLKGKGNGSAGRVHSAVKPSREWTTFHRVFTVPANTAAVQYNFRVTGTSGVLMDNIAVTYTPDTVSVPMAKKVDFGALPNAWTWNPQHLQYGFYTRSKDSSVPALIQIAADKNALCIMFRNFTDPAKIKKTVTKHDGAVWTDHANEIFIFDEKRNTGWQFAVTAGNTALEGKLVQHVPGDPWKCDSSWNGKWQHKARVTADGFETRFYIPWSTLDIDPAKAVELKFNAAADYPDRNEYPTWCNYTGNRTDVAQYGTLKLANNTLTITRFRNTEKLSYALERKNPQFAQVLQKGVKGNYQVDVWAAGLARGDFSKTQNAEVSDKTFYEWQSELLRAWHAANIGGPAWPWAFSTGKERMIKFQKMGMKHPMMLSNSDLGRKARKNGAKFIAPNSDWLCDVNDPEYINALIGFIRGRKNTSDYPYVKNTIKFALGIDEPTNVISVCYDPRSNKAHALELQKHSDMIKKEFGFNQYGSPFMPGIAESEQPFARIAFYRWWNSEFKKNISKVQDVFKAEFPNVPMVLTDDNNTSGQSALDAGNLNNVAEIISCDPYPTATKAIYGMSRALYHVGYSTRVLKDLIPSAKIMVMPQCFVYHGSHGDLAAMREWTSQALKNGAVHFMWYCAKAPGTIFKDYADMLELSAMIGKMDKVALPANTSTLVWYSNFDKWAKNDYAQHRTYSVYAMLFEHAGSNFKFVSDTTLDNDSIDINQYKLLYVPQMTYTTEKITAKLADWVKNGGTMVIFDPQFAMYNIDGTPNTLRTKLTGQRSDMPVKTTGNHQIKWQNKILPAAVTANQPQLPGSRYESYTVTADGSKVIASYNDNTPAVIERPFGKGKVIFFGIQPFAGSDLASQPDAWRDFFQYHAQQVNEKTDLPIKDFLLPVPPATVKLKQFIK